MYRPKTIFCDIDGTLVTHGKPTDAAHPDYTLNLLKGTHQTLNEWDRRGYKIILTTGRKESLRKVTEKQLAEAGIIYDQLVMGIGGGDRVLINDRKPNGRRTAWAVVPPRDLGLESEIVLNLTEVAEKYFKCWGEKKVDELEKLFSDDIHLKDWEHEAKGKTAVLKSNVNVFSGIQNLGVTVHSLSHTGSTVFCKLTVHANDVDIPVVDILEFNRRGRIKSITAYRGN